MNKNNNTETVCARCAARFPTCCRLSETEAAGAEAAGTEAAQAEAGGTKAAGADESSQCFPLSAPERARLEAALRDLPAGAEKPPLEAVLEQADNSPAFLAALLELFPGRAGLLERLYPPGHRHWRMKLRPNGSCACLGPQGCLLPQTARPRFCRLFPFWVTRGSLACFTPDDCLAVRENKSLRALLRAFDLNEAELRQRYRDLCKDWNIS